MSATLTCERMRAATRADAFALLASFLGDDEHYLSTASVYGDGGRDALGRALDLFLARPELGFVWLAFVGEAPRRHAAGVCVVSYAISTSRGSLVAKLDDVHVDAQRQSQGVGTAMLRALAEALRSDRVTRIDTACHRDNALAWRFYERLGFRPLAEERIALLL